LVIATNGNSKRAIAEFQFNTGDFALNLSIDKYLFDLDNDGIVWLTYGWNTLPKELNGEATYSLLLNGTKIWNGKVGSDTDRYSYRGEARIFKLREDYRFTILIEYENGTFRDEIVVKVPQQEEFPDLSFDLQLEYEGYTTCVFNSEGLSLPAFYKTSLSGFSEIVVIEENIFDIANIPIQIAPNRTIDLNQKIEVYSYINDTIGGIKSLDFEPKTLYRLPDADFTAKVYNIKDRSFNLVASNRSDIPTFDTGFNGPEVFFVELNENKIGNYQCYWSGGISSSTFPTFGGLEPNSSYNVKVGVDYNNFIPNLDFEILEIPFTTFITFEITTDSVSISSELDVYIENVDINSFEIIWKTDMVKLHSCDPFWTSYEFSLYLNDSLYNTFSSDQNPFVVDNLKADTNYDVLLECSLLLDYFGEIIVTKKRTAQSHLMTLPD
jgi:hypothetical protein